MTKIAIIGTAGRDRNKPMVYALWKWMVQDALERVPKGAHLVSGGAAWADHLAVHLYLLGHASALTLHLPAPFENGQFMGPAQSAAQAANYYHELFSKVLNRDTLADLTKVENMPNVDGTIEPYSAGYGAMFARNSKVAQVDGLLAYTFGEGDVPADGGTKDTWNKCQGEKLHIQLPMLPSLQYFTQFNL